MFFQRIIDHSTNNPNKMAINDLTRSMTYRELWEEFCCMRACALSLGMNQESKVILRMNHSCEWATIVLGLTSLGVKVVMISPETKEEQVESLCSKLGIFDVITEDNCKPYFNRNNQAMSTRAIEFPDPQCEVVYHVTSGSTGQEKICIRTIEQFFAEGDMYEDRLKIKEEDVIVCPLPLYHSFAFGAVFIAGLMAGTTIVLMPRFTPRKYLELLTSQKATLSVIVPAIAGILVKTNLKEPVDLSKMHSIIVGTGVVSEEVFVGFYNKYGIGLSSNYGSSETGGIITRTEMKDYPSIGRPMKGVQVQIRTENRDDTDSNLGGQMWVKAPSVMNRYFDNAKILDEDGYFFTGDLARVDSNNNIFITGRAKNIVNIGGKKVNPTYIENILKDYYAVKEAVVMGKCRKQGGEYLVSIISGSNELNKRELNQYLSSKLEPYMIPTIIKIVDAIPKNKLGKVKRESVLEMIEE